MIRYDLRCANRHGFDAWFRDSTGYESEREAGRVTCPLCGDARVEKALMAPAVPSKGGDREREPVTASLSAPPTHPLHKALAELRQKLEREADYVGDRFAAEARRIHTGEAESRAIWGEATLAEAKALVEEGAPIAPLPPMPKRNG
jgi:hypothetical protein